eukprot:scaffold126661_cov28-Tisochrysis_lutea.AAC.9
MRDAAHLRTHVLKHVKLVVIARQIGWAIQLRPCRRAARVRGVRTLRQHDGEAVRCGHAL